MPILILAQPILDDGTGTPHPNAVYVITDIHEDIADGLGSITLLPFHDAASLLAHEKGLSQCQVILQLNNADFNVSSAYAVQAGTFSQAESEDLVFMAKTVKNTPSRNADGTPILDGNNQPVLVPFFQNATVQTIG